MSGKNVGQEIIRVTQQELRFLSGLAARAYRNVLRDPVRRVFCGGRMSGKNVGQEIIPMTQQELSFLSGLAARAYRNVLRDPEGKIPGLVTTRPMRRKDGSPPERRARRVACLTFDMLDPKPYVNPTTGRGGAEALHVVGAADPFQVVCYADNPPGQAQQLAVAMLRQADRFLAVHGAGLHYLVVNELALSFHPDLRNGLIAHWRTLASQYDVYIVPGTYHCGEFGTNNAVVCPPQEDLKPKEVRKQNSATRQGEIVRTPDIREVVYFRTDFGNVGIWICLDMYDPGLVFKLLSVTHRLSHEQRNAQIPGRELHMMLVPSFNKTDRDSLATIAKDLSLFTNTAFFVSNSFADGGETRRFSLGYCCGVPLACTSMELDGAIADIYEFSLQEIEERQADSFGKSSIFSTQFKGVVTGDLTQTEIPD